MFFNFVHKFKKCSESFKNVNIFIFCSQIQEMFPLFQICSHHQNVPVLQNLYENSKDVFIFEENIHNFEKKSVVGGRRFDPINGLWSLTVVLLL